jgi:hypothetical protein
MPMEQIEFVIRPDGTVEERVVGVKGADCRKLTQDIEAAVGVVEASEPTAEYFEQPQPQWEAATVRR